MDATGSPADVVADALPETPLAAPPEGVDVRLGAPVEGAEDPLAAPPHGDDDLTELVQSRGRGRGWPRGSLLLAGAVLLAGGFLGGVFAQQQLHPATPSATGAASRFAAFASRFGGSGSGAGGGGASSPFGGRGGSGATVGTIKLIDGDNVYVQVAGGNYLKVRISPSTRVLVSKRSSVAGLSDGSTVVVTGTQGSGGTMAATSITEGGAGGLGFGSGSAGSGATGAG